MDWLTQIVAFFSTQIDAYCERTNSAYWSEPLNAVSNAAFLIAALAMWLRVRRLSLPGAELMSITLAAIGVASYLWHTEARAWAGAADSLSILAFILIYLHAANRDYLELGAWAAALCTAAFVPYAFALGWIFAQLPFFEISSFYWPLVPLMLVYGLAIGGRAPRTGGGLHAAAGLLTLSLIARSLDESEQLCAALPVGTHFLWHLLNGALLGWVIEVYRRHMLARDDAQG